VFRRCNDGVVLVHVESTRKSEPLTNISSAATAAELRLIPVDKSSAGITLVESAAAWARGDIAASSISPDGTALMVTNNYLGSGDLWIVPLEPAATARASGLEPRAFTETTAAERDAKFAPNSRFVAYSSDESGTDEIYVAAYPGPGAKWQVSRGGGTKPHWSADGRELFYLNGDDMMVAEVETSDVFRSRPPRALFAFPQLVRNRGFPYSVAADGTRFLMLKSNVVDGLPPVQLNIVVNWLEELEPFAVSR
jgi:Tol biopolymer transport system component